jgi:putative acetyltransferase
VIIRPASRDDIPALARIAAAAYRSAFQPILGEQGLALRGADFFEQRFPDELPWLHVGEDHAGRMLGFHQVKDGLLVMLFLDPALVGRGLGALLLRHAEALGAVRLECFRDNPGARRFYEREGWRYAEAYKREFAGAERDFVAYWRPYLDGLPN